MTQVSIDRVASFSRSCGAACALLLMAACGGGEDARQVAAITAQPADASVVAGAPVTFFVAVVGSAPLAYQWHSSSDGGTTFAPISGE